MSRLSLQLEEIRNALRIAREAAEAAGRDARESRSPAESERLRAMEQRYGAIASRLERTLLDRTRPTARASRGIKSR